MQIKYSKSSASTKWARNIYKKKTTFRKKCTEMSLLKII